MNANWDDEYLTVNEIADRLQLNPQTVRNWIDRGELHAVRIGRRVRVRRSDLELVLAQGATAPAEPETSAAAPTEAIDELTEALERARRLLGRRSAVRRAELAEGLQQLTDAVAAGLELLSGQSNPPSHERN